LLHFLLLRGRALPGYPEEEQPDRPKDPLSRPHGSTVMDKPDRYIPALGFGWLTSLYDPVVRWTTREKAFKSELLRQADLQLWREWTR
jgi:hypothetical protein